MINSVYLTEDTLNEEQIKNTCDLLQKDEVKVLSLRNCKLTFSQLKNVLKNVEENKSLLQLNLNIGIITDQRRIDLLCRTIKANRSLRALFIHGNNIGDKGMKKIAKVLLHHPSIVCLDVGDCNLGDESVEVICNLLPPHGKKAGLIELTMSSNPRITEQGWIKLSVSMAASSCLQELYLDYNSIGDLAASSVLVSLASHRHLQILDLEGTCITDRFAELLLYLIENYPTKLQKVNLEDNNINPKLLKSIKSNLLDVETESETSEKTHTSKNASSLETSSDSSDTESNDSGKESGDDSSRSEVKSIEVKSTGHSLTSSPQKSPLKRKDKIKQESNTVKNMDSASDGEELIEITEPPLVTSTTSLQNFVGVNLGQVVSVSAGKGKALDQEDSDEELTEVKLVSLC